MTKNGILCEVGEKRVYLDPKNGDSTGINFVSHAHSDHLPSKNGGTILSSIEIQINHSKMLIHWMIFL